MMGSGVGCAGFLLALARLGFHRAKVTSLRSLLFPDFFDSSRDAVEIRGTKAH
ncbi:hypothetical protein [Paenibacillus sp. JDR-2]|uniref:hypothetical protein n=1 Tax=Paenibacillus sp. (strain JDR-2) TaxID=324057 RepID=UPI0001668C68|nr:hypothetical protein [Paenibacillus sp. JDR-2]ACT03406.1 hypothetical protein Pjdr2_4794 [Paenibacillus sp. JDR-2]